MRDEDAVRRKATNEIPMPQGGRDDNDAIDVEKTTVLRQRNGRRRNVA